MFSIFDILHMSCEFIMSVSLQCCTLKHHKKASKEFGISQLSFIIVSFVLDFCLFLDWSLKSI